MGGSFNHGTGNTVVGSTALQLGGAGHGSVAVGRSALRYSRGHFNIAIGTGAGLLNTTGSNNIYLGNRGAAGESGVIRIGRPDLHTEIHLPGRVVAPHIDNRLSDIRDTVDALDDRVHSLENPN